MGFTQPKALPNVVKLPKNVPNARIAGSTMTIASATVLLVAQRMIGTIREKHNSAAEPNTFHGNGNRKNKITPSIADRIKPPRIAHHIVVLLDLFKELAIFCFTGVWRI